MNKYKLALIEHAKTEPLASHYSTIAAYNSAYMAWHDRYVSLMAIAAKHNKGL